ncbi:rhodanese-like domain-containing protein [Oryzihumus sp.]|uniref:rhodanese-like domain-containing protein n=1 Tax=Oryzihumus sp. TaxID=1968903 RepID=UPI002ED8A41A
MTLAPTRTKPTRITPEELRDWMATKEAPRVLDVRSPAEFSSSHVAGSYNVPLDLLREHRHELRDHLDQDVVLICRSGARAGQAETLLAEVGLPNLHVLDGGVLAWEQAGAPLIRGRARWDLERQVRLVAGSLVLGGVLASIVWPPARWLSGAVGGGLAFAAVTNSCAMGMLLSRLPYNQDSTTDLDSVLTALADHPAA